MGLINIGATICKCEERERKWFREIFPKSFCVKCRINANV